MVGEVKEKVTVRLEPGLLAAPTGADAALPVGSDDAATGPPKCC